MKKSVILFVFVTAICRAQVEKPYELGSTLITFNNGPNTENFYFHEKPPLELMNGLFFRYKFNRWSLRAHAAYFDYSYSYTPFPECEGCDAGSAQNKEFRLGIGVQYNLIRTKEWFYGFADVGYRNVFVTGTSNGGLPNENITYYYTGNGTNSSLGLGAKFRVFREVFLSPEAGYDITHNFIDKTMTNIRTGKKDKFSMQSTNVSTMMRLHLTVRF